MAALRRADADVYYHNCAEYVTGQIAIWTRLNNRKFVYSVASEPDCDSNLPTLHSHRERILYRHGVRSASSVIVQTNTQKEMLADGFDVHSTVLPIPVEPMIDPPSIVLAGSTAPPAYSSHFPNRCPNSWAATRPVSLVSQFLASLPLGPGWTLTV